MRIAVSGAHGTGKTSLAESLANALPGYAVYDEPYYQLESEGHVFAGVPGIRDFELQLERSMKSISGSGKDGIFDRCPADILAYLMSHEKSAGVDLERWLPRVNEAMGKIDLVVFVPIEHPDRIFIPKSEGRELRLRVDERLQEILLENRLAFDCEVFEATGSLKERVEKVMKLIGAGGWHKGG
jgi:predicted ATPase